MKRTSSHRLSPVRSDDLRSVYRFDYAKARPNRFARKVRAGAVAVVLDPDVASVFQTSEAVNALLRSVISALPTEPGHRVASKRRSG